tara:strand:+ start:383 stop:589 length:207 start_codon:yes stop_codon:yes gene_type:complete
MILQQQELVVVAAVYIHQAQLEQEVLVVVEQEDLVLRLQWLEQQILVVEVVELDIQLEDVMVQLAALV